MSMHGSLETPVTIAVLRDDASLRDPHERRQWLAGAIANAPDAGLLVLPYLSPHPTFWQTLNRADGFRHAERPPGGSLDAIQIAAKARRLPVLASTYEVLGEGVFYAAAVLVSSVDEAVLHYRQEHALNLPEAHERLFFQPGANAVRPLMQLGSLRVGLLLGGDLWVPEAARLLRMAGADALLALAGWPESIQINALTLAAARSLENGLPVILANRGWPVAAFGHATVAEGESGDWQRVDLIPEEVRRRLRQNDPCMMRRPELYAALAGRWRDDA